METVNALYIPTDCEVKSIDSILQRINDRSRNGVIDSNVIVTPNPSYYSVDPNSLQSGKKSDYQYDYVQPDGGSTQHDRVIGSTTSGGVHDEVTDPADTVNIDPNPSYSLSQGDQDVKLQKTIHPI